MKQRIEIAYFGGTRMGELWKERGFTVSDPFKIVSPYSGKSISYRIVTTDEFGFVMIDRHHVTGNLRLAPDLDHEDYMYVLWKLSQMELDDFEIKIKFIFSTTAVGGLYNPGVEVNRLEVGDLVAPHDLTNKPRLSYSFHIKDRYVHSSAFYRSANTLFCPHLRALLTHDGVRNGGVLAFALEGPTYETPYEVNRFAIEGVSLMGMGTVVPEAYLARQLSAHYQPIAVVTDMPQDEKDVDGAEVEAIMDEAKPRLVKAFLAAMKAALSLQEWNCSCRKQPPVFEHEELGDPADFI